MSNAHAGAQPHAETGEERITVGSRPQARAETAPACAPHPLTCDRCRAPARDGRGWVAGLLLCAACLDLRRRLPGDGCEWTPEEDRTVADLLGCGLSVAMVAAMIGRTPASVSGRRAYLVRAAGRRASTKPRWTDEEDRRVVEMVNAGLRTVDIAQALGRTQLAVRCRRAEIMSRPASWLRQADGK